jgi:hypothetical protein
MPSIKKHIPFWVAMRVTSPQEYKNMKLGEIISPEEFNWLKIISELNKFDKRYAVQINQAKGMDAHQQAKDSKKVGQKIRKQD